LTAQANEKLSASTARRWNQLLAKDAVSQQDADDKNGDLAAKTAAVAAAQASVQQLAALEIFKRIVAPFDGVVTSRTTDIGALITVGAPNETPLFTIDDEQRLRIYVSIPQIYAGQIKPGLAASFTVPEYPAQQFAAVLAATADAIDPATGTLLAQFQVENDDLKIHPGDYAEVAIKLPANGSSVSVPASALMFRDAGEAVAVVGPDDHVIFKPVTIGRDLGALVEITGGIGPSDRVINNPPDALGQGDLVTIAAPPKGNGAP
jgi:RND family efflux transporter MFP subunit